MSEWEYLKIGLNQHGPKGNELDLLNAAGAQGWELIGITSNSIAYLKRERDAFVRDDPFAHEAHSNGDSARVSEVRVKYRDPVTGDTWTGRGRMVTWLKKKQDAGEDIEKYLDPDWD